MDGGAVGTVIDSNTASIPVGASILHHLGWREYATVDAATVRVLDTAAAPAQAYLGVLGVTGFTAYVGLKLIAPVREGDVVFVSGAAGAVGIAAGRVARALGAAKVIGSAGGPEKARRLVDDFGYDIAIDYRDGAFGAQLHAAAPDGIDVYFDNVGGDQLKAALTTMRTHGRVALCGAVSQYNAPGPVSGPDLLDAIKNRLSLRGFLVMDHYELLDEYVAQAAGWLRDGSLAPRRQSCMASSTPSTRFSGSSAAPTPGRCWSASLPNEATRPRKGLSAFRLGLRRWGSGMTPGGASVIRRSNCANGGRERHAG